MLLGNPFYKPQLLKWIETMFKHAEKHQWFESYWCFDIHGVISQPDYRKSLKEINYYPYAKETLQLLTQREDIVMFLFTSSYPDEIRKYVEIFKKDGIIFKYVNENPEINESKGCFGYYEKKPYFNVYFEDKSGFSPLKDWKPIYKYFKNTKYRPNRMWSTKYKEDYHE